MIVNTAKLTSLALRLLHNFLRLIAKRDGSNLRFVCAACILLRERPLYIYKDARHHSSAKKNGASLLNRAMNWAHRLAHKKCAELAVEAVDAVRILLRKSSAC